MAQRADTMIHPRIEDLLARTDSKFGLVTLAARRARDINGYFGQLSESLGTSIPPQVTSVARKPLSIAFEEIAVDKIVPIERVETTEADAVDEADSDEPSGDVAE